jgi:hypothetical protein
MKAGSASIGTNPNLNPDNVITTLTSPVVSRPISGTTIDPVRSARNSSAGVPASSRAVGDIDQRIATIAKTEGNITSDARSRYSGTVAASAPAASPYPSMRPIVMASIVFVAPHRSRRSSFQRPRSWKVTGAWPFPRRRRMDERPSFASSMSIASRWSSFVEICLAASWRRHHANSELP